MFEKKAKQSDFELQAAKCYMDHCRLDSLRDEVGFLQGQLTALMKYLNVHTETLPRKLVVRSKGGPERPEPRE